MFKSEECMYVNKEMLPNMEIHDEDLANQFEFYL